MPKNLGLNSTCAGIARRNDLDGTEVCRNISLTRPVVAKANKRREPSWRQKLLMPLSSLSRPRCRRCSHTRKRNHHNHLYTNAVMRAHECFSLSALRWAHRRAARVLRCFFSIAQPVPIGFLYSQALMAALLYRVRINPFIVFQVSPLRYARISSRRKHFIMYSL